VRRLVFVDHHPAYLHRGYYLPDPTRPVLESELQVTDLRGLFRSSANALIKSGDVSIEAVTLTAEEAALLQIPLDAPAMILEHHFFDFKDQPISWGWFTGSAERLRLCTRVGFDPLSPSSLRDEKAR
jgi:GntR family transcriptional regulator